MKYETYLQRYAPQLLPDFLNWKSVVEEYEQALRYFISSYMEDRSRKHLLKAIQELTEVLREETGEPSLILEELPLEIRTKIQNV